jgi:hypothetical protein
VSGFIIFIKKGLGVQMGIKEKWWRWWNGYLKVNLIKNKRKVMGHNLQEFFNSWC